MNNRLLHNRKLNRLKGFDYSQSGLYFITVCVHCRLIHLCEIINGVVKLKQSGEIVLDCWNDLPNHYPNCFLHEFVVMPNHIHGIIEINNDCYGPVGDGRSVVGDGLRPSPTTTCPNIKIHGLSEMVRALKSFSSRRINEISDIKFKWQRSFYDHIIRNKRAYNQITRYIQNNPKRWMEDRLFVH